MLQLYCRDNPRRPVNWRWERARSILEGEYPLSRWIDDEWVSQAARFRTRQQQAYTDTDHALLMYDFGPIYWAHDIRYVVDAGDNAEPSEKAEPYRSELEARILARETYPQIAARMGVEPTVIDAYEKLYFNVSERIDQRSYILHQALGPAIYTALQEQEYDVIWKLFAYMGGPRVLDMLVDTFVNPSRPETSAEVPAFIADATMAAIRRKALLAAHTLKLNNYNAVEMVGAFLKLLEIERLSGARTTGSEALLENVERMLAAMPIKVGSRVSRVDSPVLDQYDKHGVELRSEEQIAAGLGQPVPALQMLEHYVYPPPPVKHELPQLTEEHA